MRVLAVITARGGSKRLPGKNIRPLFDKPLIAWTIEFAKSIPWFDDIHVSTDSDEIASVCNDYGLVVPHLRPLELATDQATSVDVVLDVLDRQQRSGNAFDWVALLQPTTPVRFVERWFAAKTLLENENCEGVIGVSMADTHPFLTFRQASNGFLEPWIVNPDGLTRSQDYPPAYAVNGALYLVKVNTLREQRTFFPKQCSFVLCPEAVENVDIDTFYDWQVAELIIAEWMTNQ